VAAVSLAMMMSTSALGACKTTLRGELVQTPSRQAFPRKFLLFSLIEITWDRGGIAQTPFQSFVVPSTGATFPIPFALDIDSPSDCPSELELRVGSEDVDHPIFRYGDHPLTGSKMVRFDRFESVRVWGPNF
jgi:hypothetical protein